MDLELTGELDRIGHMLSYANLCLGTHWAPQGTSARFIVDPEVIYNIYPNVLSSFYASQLMDPSNPLDPKWRLVTTIMHLVAVSILSMCLSRRTFFRINRRQIDNTIHPTPRDACFPGTVVCREPCNRRSDAATIDTRRTGRDFISRLFKGLFLFEYSIATTHARFSAFLVFVSSLSFTIASAILVLGVGLNTQQSALDFPSGGVRDRPLLPTLSCHAVIYLCIFLYGTTKVFIYMFLVERVYLVSSAGTTRPRRKTLAYKCGLGGIVIYVIILVLVVVGRIAIVVPTLPPPPLTQDSVHLKHAQYPEYPEGICMIGIKPYATIPFIIYDMVLTVLLTTMFTLPLISTGKRGQKKRWWSRCSFNRSRRAKKSFFTTPPIPLPNLSGELEDLGIGAQPGDLRCLAIRSMVASSVALISSAINLIILTSHGGREEGMNCMRWCLADVVVNSLAVYFVMRGRDEGWKDSPPLGRPPESFLRAFWRERETDRSHSNTGGLGVSSLLKDANKIGRGRRMPRGFKDTQVQSLPGHLTPSTAALSLNVAAAEAMYSNSEWCPPCCKRQGSYPWATSSVSLPLPCRNKDKNPSDKTLGEGRYYPNTPDLQLDPSMQRQFERRSMNITRLQLSPESSDVDSGIRQISLQLPELREYLNRPDGSEG